MDWWPGGEMQFARNPASGKVHVIVPSLSPTDYANLRRDIAGGDAFAARLLDRVAKYEDPAPFATWGEAVDVMLTRDRMLCGAEAHLNKLIFAAVAAVRLYGPPEGRPYPCPDGGHWHVSSKY